MIKIAFRFDDPSLTSDHSLEKRVIDICKRYAVKINFAVIPYKNINGELQGLTAQKAEHLINGEKNNWIEISQHGYAHINHNKNGIPSEFSEGSHEKQYDKINQGKLILDQLFLNQRRGFVPPWNTFNNATSCVISDSDFLFFSAGWEMPASTNFSVPLLPRTCQISSLTDCLKRAKSFSSLSPIIIAVMHHFDFIESNKKQGKISLKEFEDCIKLCNKKDIQLSSLNDIARELSISHSINAILLHTKISNFHWRFKRHIPNNCLINCSAFKLYTAIAKNILLTPKL